HPSTTETKDQEGNKKISEPPVKKRVATPSSAEKSLDISSDENRSLYQNYVMPSITLLQANDGDNKPTASEAELRADQRQLIDTLAEFGVEVSPGDITRGATITRYEVFPA